MLGREEMVHVRGTVQDGIVVMDSIVGTTVIKILYILIKKLIKINGKI